MDRALFLRACAAALVVVHTAFGAFAATVLMPPALPQHASRHPALAAPSPLPVPSQHILQSWTKTRMPGGACAFRAYEIQVCNATAGLLPPSTTTYIQVNTVFAADGNVAVDVASQRPRGSYNSYQRLEPHQAFEIARLEGESLTIELSHSDVLKFWYGESKWSERDGLGESGRAWCEVGDWVGAGQRTCEHILDVRSRRRMMTCGFPCGHQDMVELR